MKKIIQKGLKRTSNCEVNIIVGQSLQEHSEEWETLRYQMWELFLFSKLWSVA